MAGERGVAVKALMGDEARWCGEDGTNTGHTRWEEWDVLREVALLKEPWKIVLSDLRLSRPLHD